MQSTPNTKLRPDEDTLLALYKEYRTEFIKWAGRSYQCSEEDAKDIYQTSIIIVYENMAAGKLDQLGSSIKTYLFAVGKNKIRELRRRQNKISPLPDDHEDIEEILEAVEPELSNLVTNSLLQIGEPCKALLQEVYYHRQSMEAIAKKLGYKNENTAKAQKYKCLMRLRKLFREFQVKTSAV